MAVHFYSFTDPAELANLEVCWTQTRQTEVEHRRQIRPAPGFEPRLSPRPGHPYGSITTAVERILKSNGPMTIGEIRDITGYTHCQVSAAVDRLVMSNRATRTGRGEYDAG